MRKILFLILIVLGISLFAENVKLGKVEFQSIMEYLRTKPDLEIVNIDGKNYLKLLVPYQTEAERQAEEQQKKVQELETKKKALLDELTKIESEISQLKKVDKLQVNQ